MSTLTPPFSDEHEQLRQSVRGFIERELAPHAQQWEEDRWFPDEVFAKMAAQGLLGLKYPAEYGGQGGDYLHESVLCEELARVGSGGTAAGIGAHTNIATPPIWKFGTDEQKQRYLVPSIAGELIGALGITEPGAGSDVAALSTRAERVDGGWVLNGEKTYITNGVRANFIVTAVKTTAEGGHHGISFLIVDRGDGVESSALHKLGWHMIRDGPHHHRPGVRSHGDDLGAPTTQANLDIAVGQVDGRQVVSLHDVGQVLDPSYIERLGRTRGVLRHAYTPQSAGA